MTNEMNTMGTPDRSYLNFATEVRKAFSFLVDMGFTEAEASPTLVRFCKDRVEVDVYHGRKSYEIDAGIASLGTRYAIAEIIRASDPEVAERSRSPVATTPAAVAAAVADLSSLMQRYCTAALQGEPKFFLTLKDLRQSWAEQYALDVLARQLRSQAEQAFRRGDYSKAAELYSRIRARLSPVEMKKLAVAEERRWAE